jgi:hypothetical protein
MTTENPYASPAVCEETPAPVELPVYRSRTQAVVAGMRRGAMIGGKWMGIILGILALLSWMVVLVTFVHRWLWQGRDFWYLIERLEPFKGICLTLNAIVLPTLYTAVGCALMMGMAAGFSYRKPPTRPSDGQPPSPAVPDQPGG